MCTLLLPSRQRPSEPPPSTPLRPRYVFVSASESQIVLKRKAQFPWRADPGALSLLSIQCPGGPKVPLGGGAGVAVATILADPKVEANPSRAIYLSQTKRLTIRGSGFALYSDAELTLEPRDVHPRVP